MTVTPRNLTLIHQLDTHFIHREQNTQPRNRNISRNSRTHTQPPDTQRQGTAQESTLNRPSQNLPHAINEATNDNLLWIHQVQRRYERFTQLISKTPDNRLSNTISRADTSSKGRSISTLSPDNRSTLIDRPDADVLHETTPSPTFAGLAMRINTHMPELTRPAARTAHTHTIDDLSTANPICKMHIKLGSNPAPPSLILRIPTRAHFIINDDLTPESITKILFRISPTP